MIDRYEKHTNSTYDPTAPGQRDTNEGPCSSGNSAGN